MPAADRIKAVLKKLRWLEKVFIALLAIYILLLFISPSGTLFALVQFATFFFGFWLAVRGFRTVARHAIWRLRNRLIVTYLFIGGVPILLIAVLVGLGIYGLASQVAVYLVTSELDRRVASLESAARGIAKTDPAYRAEAMRRMSDLFYKEYFPNITMMIRTPAGVSRISCRFADESAATRLR